MTDLVDARAERFVIGAILMSNGRMLWPLLERGISLDDFENPVTHMLWEKIQEFRSTRTGTLGPNVFEAWLRQQLPARHLEIHEAITHCTHEVTIPDAVLSVANDLMAMTARRRAEAAGIRLKQIAETFPADSPEELYDLVLSTANDVDKRVTVHKTSFDSIVIDRAAAWEQPVTDLLPTPWPDLNRLVEGGLRRGDLCIVGARPAVGKSMIATELCRFTASAGRPTYFASLEMSASVVTDRIASASTGINLSTLMSQKCSELEMAHLHGFVKRSADWPLDIADQASVRLVSLMAAAHHAAQTRGGLDLIIVDYLQLMTPADASASREQQVGSLSRGLKLLGKELNCVVVALAQVSRGAVGVRPQLHHLRESGAIEADADVVLLLHRDDTEDENSNELEVDVAKNRHGETGTVTLAWHPRIARVGSLLRST